MFNSSTTVSRRAPLLLAALLVAPAASAQTVGLSLRHQSGAALGTQAGGAVVLTTGAGHVRLGGWTAMRTEGLIAPHTIPCNPLQSCDPYPSRQSTRMSTATAAYAVALTHASPQLSFYGGPMVGVLHTTARTNLPNSQQAEWGTMAGASAGAELRLGRLVGVLGTELGLDFTRNGERQMVGVFGPTLNLGVGVALTR